MVTEMVQRKIVSEQVRVQRWDPSLMGATMGAPKWQWDEWLGNMPSDQHMFRVLSPLMKGQTNPMVYASTEIACGSLGRLRSEALVLFASPSGQTTMGQLELFCHCTSMDSPEDFFVAFYIRYVQVSDLEWAPCSGQALVKPYQEIRWPLPYVRSSGNRVIPLLPHDEIRAAW